MFTYTKLVRIELESLEEIESYSQDSTPYDDWFISQKEAGLADPSITMSPCRRTTNKDGVECVFEILLADQAQVYSWQALVFPMSKLTGYPIRHNEVTDVHITSDQIPPEFTIYWF